MFKRYVLLFCLLIITPIVYAQQELEDYFNSIKTFEADFKQIASNGTISTGKLYISKPGKIKWEYDSPKHILIVGNSDKERLIYCDYELNEVSYISSKSALLYFLSKPKLALNQDLNVLDYQKQSGDTLLKVSELEVEKQTNIASISIFFHNNPLMINKLEVEDINNNIIEVLLFNVKTNQPIDAELFVFKNPKFFKSLH